MFDLREFGSGVILLHIAPDSIPGSIGFHDTGLFCMLYFACFVWVFYLRDKQREEGVPKITKSSSKLKVNIS